MLMGGNEEMEVCAMITGCGKVFDYPKTTHIDDPVREGNYIEGIGQICGNCAYEIYSVRRGAGGSS